MDLLEAVEGFLQLAHSRRAGQPLRHLAHALDRLSLAYDTADPSAAEDDNAVGAQIERCRALASAIDRGRVVANYPELGLYRCATSISLTNDELGVSDAIEDIVEIVSDLADALEGDEGIGLAGLAERYRMLFEIHLWQHIVELRWCLEWTMMRPEDGNAVRT